jgi:hypothetical protein
MLRALVTAVAALRRAGVAHPRDHIVTVSARGGNFTALLLKKAPFTLEEERRVTDWAARSPFFRVSASPRATTLEPNIYQRFLALDDPRREQAFVAHYPFDIRPTEDDRPFFFKYSYWAHLAPSYWQRVFPSYSFIQAGVPVMELNLIALFAVIGTLAALCVYLPLRILAAQGLRPAAAKRYGTFFAAVGLGYLAVEVAFLQKFGLFLGHPNYALSVVLAALLLASGVGSLLSARLVAAFGKEMRFMSYLLAGLVLVEHAFALPYLPVLITLPLPVRCLIVCSLVFPVGVVLGTFVPTILERLKQESPEFIPWAWGINGIFSVLAPVLAVAVSTTWGINALLISAVPIYLVAGFVLPPARPAAARAGG